MDFEAHTQKSSDDSSTSSKLILYSFWQSSCSWRVRFALNHKDFERLNPLKYVPVLVDGPVVVSDSYAILLVGIKRREMNLFESEMKNNELLNWPQRLSKCLFRRFWILTDLNLLVILLSHYLEEKYPQKALLPADHHLKSLNLQVASIVSSSIQPLIMMGLLKTIEEKFGPEEQLPWAQSNIEKSFNALEKLLKDFSGRYALGDQADVFLVPQISIVIGKFDIDMSKFPTLARIYESYKTLQEFQASSLGVDISHLANMEILNSLIMETKFIDASLKFFISS